MMSSMPFSPSHSPIYTLYATSFPFSPFLFPLFFSYLLVHPFVLKYKYTHARWHSQLNWLWAEIKFPFMITTAQTPLIYSA